MKLKVSIASHKKEYFCSLTTYFKKKYILLLFILVYAKLLNLNMQKTITL